ncbi:MAG TPA: MATE family efflux transporter [Gaiellaceae bacterium]|nr:MATE family efflux transporter [Gaiellaceae bacterium]
MPRSARLARVRSPYDGEIVRLALPALGALAAEPLYVLVDTAIVGHLGRPQLAALGVAATVLGLFAVFNFLQYGTTAQTARALGAGRDETAARLGAQALWLSLALGAVLAVLLAALAEPVVALVGAEGRTASYAVTYLRIAAVGVPSALLALGGQGFLRGVADLRTPLLLVVAGNVANAVLEVVFVYGLDWGIRGSAWGTALAQTGMGAGFAWAILRRIGPERAGLRPALARRVLSVGVFILLRTASLVAAFALVGVVVAHLGDAPLAAHQIAFQLWLFLALVLDAIAIAGQIIVGRELGADRPERAYEASARMIALSVATGLVFALVLLALHDALPRAFSADDAVLDQCAAVWPLFALMQPLNGAVFALDGILIGAGDGPYLAASMLAAFAVCAAAVLGSYEAGWGIRGAWGAIVLLICLRLALLGARFLRRRWLVTGWAT